MISYTSPSSFRLCQVSYTRTYKRTNAQNASLGYDRLVRPRLKALAWAIDRLPNDTSKKQKEAVAKAMHSFKANYSAMHLGRGNARETRSFECGRGSLGGGGRARGFEGTRGREAQLLLLLFYGWVLWEEGGVHWCRETIEPRPAACDWNPELTYAFLGIN